MVPRRTRSVPLWWVAGVAILLPILLLVASAALSGSPPAHSAAVTTPYSLGRSATHGDPGATTTSNASGPGVTVATLVLWNDSLETGNSLDGSIGLIASSVALDSTDQRLYVGNAGDGANNSQYVGKLFAVSTANRSISGTISVGDEQNALALDSPDHQLFAADGIGPGNVSVVDTALGSVTYALAVGTYPKALAVDPQSDLVFVANGNSGNVTVINATVGRVVDNISGDGGAIAFDPATNDIYAVSELSTQMVAINGSLGNNGSGVLTANGQGSVAIAADPATGDLWIAKTSGNVSVIDPRSNTVVRVIANGVYPSAIAYDPGNGYIYEAGGMGSGSGNLTVLNGTTGSVVGSVNVGVQPTDMAVDAANDTLYVSNGPEGTISFVSTSPSLNYLTSVAVAPRYSSVQAGTAEGLTASALCDSGPCLGNVTYAWTLSDSLGTLNSTNGRDVAFTAGSAIGSTTLDVAASLDGITVEAVARVNITSPLVGVALDPTAVSIAPASSVIVRATANCGATACSVVTTFGWTLPGSLGTLNTTSGPSVRFTAGSTTGSVTLTVTGKLYGASASAKSIINISTSPVTANLSQSAAAGPAPLTVWFNASAGGGPGPYSYAWTFGDSTSGSGASVAHTYTSVGVYSVVLVVLDFANDSTRLSALVQVYSAPTGGSGGSNSNGGLSVSISGDPVTGRAPLSTVLDATASGGDPPYSFEWNFGDGSRNQSGGLVSHSYTISGEYAAVVFVADQAGDQVETGVFVDVGNGSSATLSQLAVFVTVFGLRGTVPFTAHFAPVATGGTGSYSLKWNFGDGSPIAASTGLAPVTHTYTSSGAFYPQLTLYDGAGNSADWNSSLLGHPVTVATSANPGGPSGSELPGLLWISIAALVAGALVTGTAVGSVLRSRRDETASAQPSRSGYEAYRPQPGASARPVPPLRPANVESATVDPEGDML